MGECSECGRTDVKVMPWGDRGQQPPVCGKCYFDPGWYREDE